MVDTTSGTKHKRLGSVKGLDPVDRAVISDLKSINKKRGHKKDHSWTRVEGPLFTLILETFLDPVKKKILDATSKKSLTIPQILDACKISHTGGYRKISSLIQDNLLVVDGNIIRNCKNIKKFKSRLEDVRINMDKNTTSVKVKFTKR